MSDTSTLAEIEHVVHARFTKEPPADTDLAHYLQERFALDAARSLDLARSCLIAWDAFASKPGRCPQCNGDELGILPSGFSFCERAHAWRRPGRASAASA